MNLLIYILSLIMILAVMTYSRLESFARGRIQSQEWSWIMKESERDLYNQKQTLCNKLVKDKKPEDAPEKEGETPPSKDSPPPKDPPPPKENKTPSTPSAPPGSGLISTSWLLKKEVRDKEGFDKAKALDLIEQVMIKVWGNQPFYKRLEAKRPQFVKALLNEIMAVADKAQEEADKKDQAAQKTNAEEGVVQKTKPKLNSLDDLIFVPWNDNELKEAFGRMLQEGLVYDRNNLRTGDLSEITYSSPKGFQSLKDYFILKNQDKIRVWLAPRSLLEILFPDPEDVKELIAMRKTMNQEIKKQGAQGTEAMTKQFEEAFSGKTPYPDLLDFRVTTTDTSKR